MNRVRSGRKQHSAMSSGCRGTAWSEPRSLAGRGGVRIDGGCTANFSRIRRARRARPPAAGAALTEGTAHQALYRRWRAQTFSEIVGQEAVVQTLRNAVLTGRVAHAILFTGPRGTGKTSLARIVAKAVNCSDLRAQRGPLRPLPVVHGHPRRAGTGPGRDRRRVQSRHRQHPRPPRAPGLRAPGPPAQGLHPRRGPPDHQGRLERAPQVARGATRVRHLHVRVHASAGLPARHPVARPALRRPPAHGGRDHRQAGADPGRRRPGGGPRGGHAGREARRRRDARRRVHPRPAARAPPAGGSTRRRSATSWASPTPSRSVPT